MSILTSGLYNPGMNIILIGYRASGKTSLGVALAKHMGLAFVDTDKLVRWYDFQAPLYAIWRNRYDTELVRHVTQIFQDRPPQ